MLADLDELTLKCRDERARAYIREAVTCCKAGAYRSAIVSTWIAVVFDIIDKIRELALSADRQAAQLIESYDQIIGQNDFPRAMTFERTLLQIAKDSFELISEQEHTDLERLRLDRNRCAHPSHVSPAEIFSPPAELARMHIRAAVDSLLQHEPAQGKAALDGLMKIVSSQYFARNDDDALTVLSSTPLRRARPSLVRNFTLLLLKDSLRQDVKPDQQWRNRHALRCVAQLHPATWTEVLAKDLTRLYRNLGEDALSQAVRVLGFHASLVGFLARDQIVRLQQYVPKLVDGLELLDDVLRLAPLVESALQRVGTLSAKEVSGLRLLFLPDVIRDHMVRSYITSQNYDDANAWGIAVKLHAIDLTPEQIREVINAAASNGEIRASFRVNEVLDALRRTRVISEQDFDAHREAALAEWTERQAPRRG